MCNGCSGLEPTELEIALYERAAVLGYAVFGPLTQGQTEALESWERYQEESGREYEEMMNAGGRTICPQCGERSVVHSTVCTLGYRGHPGAEYSGFAECGRDECDYADLA